jgi:hypothetical protein
MSFNTLHIFGYGETQVITDTENKKVASDELSDVQPVVDNVYSLKPADSDASADYRTINIFNGLFVDYSDNEGRRFRVEYSELDSALIDTLVEEVLNY